MDQWEFRILCMLCVCGSLKFIDVTFLCSGDVKRIVRANVSSEGKKGSKKHSRR